MLVFTSMRARRVFLEKWYMDVVSPEGDAAILYHARISIGAVRIRYRSALLAPRDAPTRSIRLVTRGAEPRVDAAGAEYRVGSISGLWARRGEPARARLDDGPDGTIDWEAVVPAADAEIRIGNTHIRGTGYVERLTMSVPPWRFRFRELRWGRFIGRRAWLTWIDWRHGPGGERRTWIATEHALHRSGHVTETEVARDIARLRLEPERTLHDAPLGDTLGSLATLVRPLVPASFLNARETKFLARARLESPAGYDSGWAIHELVTFPHVEEDMA